MELHFISKKNKSFSSSVKKLETRGCCFLCLNVLKLNFKPINLPAEERGFENQISLSYLRRYLKINLEELPLSSTLPLKQKEKKDEVGVVVELCESCDELVSSFSSKFKQLETLQLELNSCLEGINQRILETTKSPAVVEHYLRKMKNEDQDVIKQQKFVDSLRKEIAKRSRKLCSGVPPVFNPIQLTVPIPTQKASSSSLTLSCPPVSNNENAIIKDTITIVKEEPLSDKEEEAANNNDRHPFLLTSAYSISSASASKEPEPFSKKNLNTNRPPPPPGPLSSKKSRREEPEQEDNGVNLPLIPSPICSISSESSDSDPDEWYPSSAKKNSKRKTRKMPPRRTRASAIKSSSFKKRNKTELDENNGNNNNDDPDPPFIPSPPASVSSSDWEPPPPIPRRRSSLKKRRLPKQSLLLTPIPAKKKRKPSARSLALPYSKNPETGTYDCKTCFKSYNVSEKALRHYRLDHLLERHLCHQCGAAYRDKKMLQMHQRKCNGIHPKDKIRRRK